MSYIRLLFYPLSLLYGWILQVRNYLYAAGIFRSKKYKIPVISIGNLALGGAGKSPMAEYLIRLLAAERRIAVLSRGYGRRTKGYRPVEIDDPSEDTGDEPLQFKKKFPDLTVAVCEKRVTGIDILEKTHDVVIMDDAYQHRAVDAGFKLLLFDFTRLHEPQLVLPAGNLREPFSGRTRADAIVITKTDAALSVAERGWALKRVRPQVGQPVFFSYLKYGSLQPLFGGKDLELSEIRSHTKVYLITGIANPAPLYKKISSLGFPVRHYDYPDHHPFSRKNISKLAEDFRQDGALHKIVITTEKDVQRLLAGSLRGILDDLPVFYLPVEAEFHDSDKQSFNFLVKNYVSSNL